MALTYSVPLVGSVGKEKEPIVPIYTYGNIVLFENVFKDCRLEKNIHEPPLNFEVEREDELGGRIRSTF